MFNLVHNGTVLDVTQRVKVCKDVVLQAQEAAEPPPMMVGSVRVTLKEDDYSALLGLRSKGYMFYTSLILTVPASVSYDWVATLLTVCCPHVRAIHLNRGG